LAQLLEWGDYVLRLQSAVHRFKRVRFSAAFYLSIEFQDTGYLVERFYKTSYGDAAAPRLWRCAPDSVPVVRYMSFWATTQEIGLGVVVGQGNWQQQLENNKQAFADRFCGARAIHRSFPAMMSR